jgi:hypothetical protein
VVGQSSTAGDRSGSASGKACMTMRPTEKCARHGTPIKYRPLAEAVAD